MLGDISKPCQKGFFLPAPKVENGRQLDQQVIFIDWPARKTDQPRRAKKPGRPEGQPGFFQHPQRETTRAPLAGCWAGWCVASPVARKGPRPSRAGPGTGAGLRQGPAVPAGARGGPVRRAAEGASPDTRRCLVERPSRPSTCRWREPKPPPGAPNFAPEPDRHHLAGQAAS